MKTSLPILYSFRRCPYAMRARLAVMSSGQECELREIVLRDKAPEFLKASPKATVPVLVQPNGEVLEESLDVMLWALGKNDPDKWLEPEYGSLEEMLTLIDRCELEFKAHLDRYKYPNRYEGVDPSEQRAKAGEFLLELETRLGDQDYLYGNRPALADMAISPFIRQFANVDRAWFDQQPWPELIVYLDRFLDSALFASIMRKYPKWVCGDPVTLFSGS